MLPSDEPRRAFDWRGWLILVWVAWFGLLYGKMILNTRGQTIRQIIPIAGKR